MATNDIVQARIDRATKAEAASVLAAIGLTVSDAVRMMLMRIAQDKQLPFEPLRPNEVTLAAMREARRELSARFKSVDALMADLNADD